ncbi:MAG: hypothetical protein H7319_19045 [Spirosoma sp.]|nr:hypothetical protein [Spirosoma sp.]
MGIFSFEEDEISVLLGTVLNYVSSKYNFKPKQMAENLHISLSYFYRIRNPNSEVSSYTRKSFFINLLKKHKLSILKDKQDKFHISEEAKKSFYIQKYFWYLYEKDSKKLISLRGEVDLLEQDYFFINSDDDTLFAGEYRENYGYTSYSLNTISSYSDIIHWGEDTTRAIKEKVVFDQVDDNEEEFNSKKRIAYNISMGGDLSDVTQDILFGSFTRYINYNKIFSGRVVMSTTELKELPYEVSIYLTNQKFHEFFDHNVDVNNIEDLRIFVATFDQKVKYINLDIPEELVTAYQQFLSFFSNYVEVTKGKNINFDILKNQDGLTIDIELLSENIDMNGLKIYIDEYLKFSQQNIDDLMINIETDLASRKFDIFVLELKQQINNLKQSLDIAHLKNSMLQEDNKYLRNLVEKFANKESTIHLQLINGGEQQFADKIKNQL